MLPSTSHSGLVGPIQGEKPYIGHLVGPLAEVPGNDSRAVSQASSVKENRTKSAPGEMSNCM